MKEKHNTTSIHYIIILPTRKEKIITIINQSLNNHNHHFLDKKYKFGIEYLFHLISTYAIDKQKTNFIFQRELNCPDHNV